MNLQSAIHAIYPPQCVACDTQTAEDHGLCGACWGDARFVTGLACDLCAAPLIGQDSDDGLLCDDCMTTPRPWTKGRAALIYDGIGRKITLALKHGDRTELAVPAARWMAHAGRHIVSQDMLVMPVPLHWSRLLKRRYNQAALLSRLVAKNIGAAHCPDALIRPQKTKSLDGHSRDARFAALDSAITVHPRRARLLTGRQVLIVDDVMTSGATFAAASEAALQAGATKVCVLALARVVKDT